MGGGSSDATRRRAAQFVARHGPAVEAALGRAINKLAAFDGHAEETDANDIVKLLGEELIAAAAAATAAADPSPTDGGEELEAIAVPASASAAAPLTSFGPTAPAQEESAVITSRTATDEIVEQQQAASLEQVATQLRHRYTKPESIWTALETGHVMTSLDLEENDIDDEAEEALLEAVKGRGGFSLSVSAIYEYDEDEEEEEDQDDNSDQEDALES